MELEYRKCGDYYIPNLVAPENMKNFKIGKYGKLRLRYLKEHKKAEYTIMLMDNKLQSLKNNGRLMFNEKIPYSPQMIATITRHQIGTVERALKM